MTMSHLQRDGLPFYYALADAFNVCDGYHASLFGVRFRRRPPVALPPTAALPQ